MEVMRRRRGWEGKAESEDIVDDMGGRAQGASPSSEEQWREGYSAKGHKEDECREVRMRCG